MSTSNPGELRFKYLQQGDLRQLEQLVFAPRRMVDGRYSGLYSTRQRGQSAEFRDYRPYLPGDEISSVDWKVYGRSDRLVIRLFEHHSELTLHLLLDASASMAYRGAQIDPRNPPDSKFEYACRLAAAIGFLTIRQQNRFSFAMTQRLGTRGASPLVQFTAAEGTFQHLAGVLRMMESARPRGQSALADALHELGRRGRRRELLIVFSDLLDDSGALFEALASRVHHGGEAVVIHVLHPEEISLPAGEAGIFVDSETGETVRLDVGDVRGEYERRLRTFLDEWESRCSGLGVDYFRAEMSEPYAAGLQRYLLGRSAIRR